jgi:Stress responsive A/B Barrel Domain
MTDRAQHVVLFKFPRELSMEEEQEMFRRVGEWPESIPGFTGLRLGKDEGGRSNGFSYLLLTEFESEEAHQAYYAKNAHVAFSEFVMGLGCEVIRVDYPLNSETQFI